MDLRRIFLILRQRAWVIVGITISLLCLYLAIPLFSSQVRYVSTAKILLTPSRRASSGVGLEAWREADRSNWVADEQTLRELLTSERLLSKVNTTCGSHSTWQELKEQISFDPLSLDFMRRVNLFSLTFQASSPQESKTLADATVSEFTKYVEELSAREFANTRRFLEELVAEAKERIDGVEEKLLAITTAHADQKQSEMMAENLISLDSDRRKVKEEMALAEAELGSIQAYASGKSSILPSSLVQKNDSTLTQMESAVATNKLKLLELQQLYTEDNPQVREQKERLQKIQQLYDSRQSEFATSLEQEKSQILAQKQKQLRGIEERIYELRHQQLTPSEKREVAKLERQLAMWEDNHLNLVKQLYQARVVEQSMRRQGAISLLEHPGPGVRARDKREQSTTNRALFGIPICCGLAIAAVVTADLLSSNLRILPRVEETLGVKVLSVIPCVDGDIAGEWERLKTEEIVATESLLYTDEELAEMSQTGTTLARV